MARPYRRRSVSTVNRAYSRDPLERIESIGGINSDLTHWQVSQTAAIALIEAGSDEFFIEVGSQTVKLVVAVNDGEKYLQTEREETYPDDLLNVMLARSRNP